MLLTFMEKQNLLQRAEMLEVPTASGWWYSVGSFGIRICYVNFASDVYSYIGAEMPDQCRKVSIQEGIMWLKTTEREAAILTEKHGTLHLA
jgi:hypothetical protein